MSRTIARPAAAGALCFAITCAAAQPALAQSETTETTPTATAAASPVIAVGARKLNVRAGRRTAVRGRVAPGLAGITVSLQLRRDGRWKPLDRDRTDARGRYRLRERLTRTGSTPVRIRVSAGPGVRSNKKRIGRLNVYRYAQASWYGPGLYGQQTGCGGTLG